MSFHGPLTPEGGESAGWLETMPEAERLVVWSLRRWLDGPDGQAEVWNAFATRLGAERGRNALRAFEAYLEALATGTTRRLCRHAAGCPCVGRDEADLAAIVTLAARGEPGATSARAARFVAPDRLAGVVAASARLGGLLVGSGPARKEGPAMRGARFRTLH